MWDSKTEKVAGIIRGLQIPEIRKLLVVGCGNGIEAAILVTELNTRVTGIDLKNDFDQEAAKIADLRTGDAMSLEFADESFDFVFSYHALEHIAEPETALREMSRVLRKGGGFWIGTPNRARILGYIGGKETSFRQKISWNLTDWRARLAGRFRNELGAHAGFTASELSGLISAVFPVVNEMTEAYFATVYENHRVALMAIEKSRLSGFIYPSVYFAGVK